MNGKGFRCSVCGRRARTKVGADDVRVFRQHLPAGKYPGRKHRNWRNENRTSCIGWLTAIPEPIE